MIDFGCTEDWEWIITFMITRFTQDLSYLWEFFYIKVLSICQQVILSASTILQWLIMCPCI